jgi:hypothetical protein
MPSSSEATSNFRITRQTESPRKLFTDDMFDPKGSVEMRSI